MILHHWQGHAPNFGDELNTLLWPRLLPGFFDDEPDTRFLGIGSILDSRHPSACVKVVAGAGYAGYERKAVIDQTWVIHWVRGPLTAACLGLRQGLALGDPAMLLPLAIPCPANRPGQIGFMPHFESLTRGPWAKAASMADMTLIDPREPPEAIIDAISRCRVLLSESLHGAIVADTMRVPWIAIRPLAQIHRRKWRDWAGAIGLTIRPQALPASSADELLSVSRIARLHRVRQALTRYRHELNALWPDRFLGGAAEALHRAAAGEPQLSAHARLDRCQAQMMDAIVRLRQQPMQSALGSSTTAGSATSLRPSDNSAYQLRPIG